MRTLGPATSPSRTRYVPAAITVAPIAPAAPQLRRPDRDPVVRAAALDRQRLAAAAGHDPAAQAAVRPRQGQHRGEEGR